MSENPKALKRMHAIPFLKERVVLSAADIAIRIP
jgi:hypothetical protein